ncbi:MAG: hypothetical protein H6809_02585 [Phycisphaeraceae bacterium]|nr:hypothetical protein [Phycisphaeraceae bacterium]
MNQHANPNPPTTNTLDDAIKLALAEDPGGQRDSITSLLADSLRGQNRFLSTLMIVVQLAMFALAIASIVWFFDAETTRWQIFYAAAFLWLMNAMGLIKAWFWMQIHRNRVLREIKRLELQVARLAERE